MKRLLFAGALAALVLGASPTLSQPHREGGGGAAAAGGGGRGFGGAHMPGGGGVAGARMSRGGGFAGPHMPGGGGRGFAGPRMSGGGFGGPRFSAAARAPHYSPHAFASTRGFRGGAGARSFHGAGALRSSSMRQASRSAHFAQTRRLAHLAGAQGAVAHSAALARAGVAHQGRVAFGAPHSASGPGAHAQPRYNPRYYPRSISAVARYHWTGSWRPQPGFYYRHWGYGDLLPFGWFAAPFWIDDYWLYDLPIAPFGYVWVRVGWDALLVNVYTGRIVEVVYGLFW